MENLIKYRELLLDVVYTIDEMIRLESESVPGDDPRYLAALGRLVVLQRSINSL